MTPHKHAAIIKAWADGAEIQSRFNDNLPWHDNPDPNWQESWQYRVKPLMATEVIVKADYVLCPHCGAECGDWLGDPRGHDTQCDECNQPFAIHPDADMEMRS